MMLEDLDWNFRQFVRDVEEIYPDDLPVRDVPEYLARLKADGIKEHLADNEISISSDTIVLMNNTIYGKPKDAVDATNMLKTLSGSMHEVLSGVCLMDKQKTHSFSVATKVYFNELQDETIQQYIEECHPFDKAGSYAIQEWIGMVGIEKIEGDYFNVVGLPLSKLYEELLKF